MKFKLSILSATILFFNTPCFAAPAMPVNNQNAPQTQDANAVVEKKKIDPKLQAKLNVKVDSVSEEQYQKIVDEYKQYLRNIPSEVRQEIRTYRQEIVQINKTKSAMYKKLSQAAQNFLAKERDIKKKLPIHNKAAFVKEIRNSAAE